MCGGGGVDCGGHLSTDGHPQFRFFAVLSSVIFVMLVSLAEC